MIAVRNFSRSKKVWRVSQWRKERVAMVRMDVVVRIDFTAEVFLLLGCDDGKTSCWLFLMSLFDFELNKAPPLHCPI